MALNQDSQQMNLETKQENGILYVKPLDKSLEAVNSKEFKAQVIELITQGRTKVLLNLSKIEFIDSSGLSSLISILKLVANSKGSLVICETQDQARRVFSLTRLDQAFQMFSTEQEGMRSLENFTIKKS